MPRKRKHIMRNRLRREAGWKVLIAKADGGLVAPSVAPRPGVEPAWPPLGYSIRRARMRVILGGKV